MATLKDIAKEAGVTEMTVSNVLNGKIKGVRGNSAKRAEKIRKIARRLGYRPSAAARAMATGRFNTVGLLQSPDRPGVFANNPHAQLTALQLLGQRDLQLVAATVSEDDFKESNLPRMLREWSVDGYIIDLPETLHTAAYKYLRQGQVPVVSVHDHDPLLSVTPDEDQGGRLAIERMLLARRERLAYFGPPSPANGRQTAARTRLAGLQAAAGEHGLSEIEVASPAASQGPVSPQDRMAAARKLLRRKDRPDGIIVADYRYAHTLLLAAARADLAVPEDLGVLCFSQTEVTASGVRLDTLQVPADIWAEQAVRLLIDRIDGVDLPGRDQPQHLTYEYHKGETLLPEN